MARIRHNEDGSIQFEVYGGVNPATGRKLTHSATVPADAEPGEADAVLAALLARAELTKGNTKAATVSALVEHYLDTAEAYGLANTTVETGWSLYRCHVKPTIGRLRWEKVSREDFSKLYKSMLGEGYSQKTVRRVHNFLSGCFTALAKDGVIGENPILNMRIPVGRSKEVKPLSEHDFQALLGWIHSVVEDDRSSYSDVRCAVAWQLVLATGMRRGELAALTPDSFRRWGEVRIEHSLAQLSNGGLVYKQPKTRSSRRNVSLDESTTELVSWFLSKRTALVEREPGLFRQLFCDKTGEIWQPRQVTRDFKQLVRKLNLEQGTHLHSLRHTHATYLLENGENLKTIQERLGHSSSNVTLGIYSHVMPGRDVKAAETFARVADGMADRWRMAQSKPAPQTCPRTGETCCVYETGAQKNK